MKRSNWILLVAVIAAIVFVMFASGALHMPETISALDSHEDPNITFEGGHLLLPSPLHEYEMGSRGGTLALREPGRSASTGINLVDERSTPIDAGHFVSGWAAAAEAPGFRPKALGIYHDAAVDGARLRCVTMRWTGSTATLQLVCVTPDGLWKLSLNGDDSDVDGFDAIAQQLPRFESEVAPR
jgi:hypothetical protein